MSADHLQQSDATLLARYVHERDEDAFAQLVRQYESLVVGTAMRRTGNLEAARDVAQTVFVTLARKASWLATRRNLAGWLHQAASYSAARAWESEFRRQRREAAAVDLVIDREVSSPDWAAMEQSLHQLAETEREALVLHYFRDRSYAEMAHDLGISEATARKRVSRGVTNLGERLKKQGAGGAALSLLVSATAMQSSIAAQSGLAGAVLASSAAGSVSVPLSLTLSAMTSHTALKVSAVILVLGAVPLGWRYVETSAANPQTTVSQALQVEASGAENKDAQNRKASRSVDTKTSMQTERLIQARSTLAGLRQERTKAEAQLVSLRQQAKKLDTEVVVALGRVDDIARQVGAITQLFNKVDRMKNDEAERSKLGAEALKQLTEAMPALLEIRRFQSNPKLGARFEATSIAAMCNVDDRVRDQMESLLLPHFEGMLREGLTLDHRPAENSGTWDRRYVEATAAAYRSVQQLVPPQVRESQYWQELAKPALDSDPRSVNLLNLTRLFGSLASKP